MVPVVTREAMEDQAAGMGPHRLGFPERSSEARVLSVDQLAGMVERSPSELRSSEVRVERLDQEAGRVPPREGDLRGAMSEMSEMSREAIAGGGTRKLFTHACKAHSETSMGYISRVYPLCSLDG